MDLSKFEVKDVVQWLQAQPNVPPEIPTAIVGKKQALFYPGA